MIVLLIVIILLLIGCIVYLNIQFYREKRKFKIRIESMQAFIAEIARKQSGQLGRIKLSDDFNETLKTSNAAIGQDLFALNYELFDLLSKNNLLKK